MVRRTSEASPPEFIPFDGIFGLEAPRTVLWGALERDRTAGSYLLKGPTGVGKTTLARAFAQAAACTSPASAPHRACEACRSCRLAAAGVHPEIALIRPAGDQTQIWQFWNRPGKPPGALEGSLAFSPTIGRRRVYIIERADTLNEAASNSLLKVIEEPPPYALFVLLTPNAERLLPTVLSRCQAVTLTPAPVEALAEFIARQTGLPSDRAFLAARLAEGRCGTARVLASSAKALEDVERCLDLAGRLATAPPLRALRLAEEIRHLAGRMEVPEPAAPADEDAETKGASASRARVDRRSFGQAFDLLAFAFRDILACHHGFGPSTAGPAVSDPRTCLRALDVLLAARRRLDQNVPPNLLTDWVAVTIAGATPQS